MPSINRVIDPANQGLGPSGAVAAPAVLCRLGLRGQITCFLLHCCWRAVNASAWAKDKGLLWMLSLFLPLFSIAAHPRGQLLVMDLEGLHRHKHDMMQCSNNPAHFSIDRPDNVNGKVVGWVGLLHHENGCICTRTRPAFEWSHRRIGDHR